MSTAIAVRGRIEPEHVLTIAGSPTGKIGSCRCGGWTIRSESEQELSSDDITDGYITHLAAVGASWPACGRCDASVATVRRGVVFELCGGCALEEVSDRSEGHPDRREDPDRSDTVAVPA